MGARKRPRPSRAVAELRRRLQEAEDTLAAIRDGHVEALVVYAPEGEQVYTLRSADHLYRLMVEQMREGALTLGADGTILYCNSRFAELVGTPAERIPGRSLGEFLIPTHDQQLHQLLTANSFRHECEIRDAEGSVIPVQVSSTALVIDGTHTVAAVVSDLTQERSERGLRESNRLKDEFLQTLSHELRTPLNVILGWTRMLLTSHHSDEARQHALELIDRNARAQAQLVNDLVDMSRLTVGKVSLDLESVPAWPAVQAAVDSIRPSGEAKGVTIETVSRMGDEHVLADPTRLQQILWNLLSNAVKFTPAGGRIAATLRHEDGRIQIEVADSGIGIDKSFLPQVFDRFRQADGGTTRGYGGLGLGLSIVRELVLLHDGQVKAESRGRGKGATFIVTLPAASAPVLEAPVHPSAAVSSLAGRRVLLVEDHADSRDLLARTLENAGAVVTAFDAAAPAFEALGELQPSVIVADIGLPEEDGYSFIQRVRAHQLPAIQSVPAIAVTAYAAGADRVRALTAGFQRYLTKPIDPRLLIEAIHEVAGSGD